MTRLRFRELFFFLFAAVVVVEKMKKKRRCISLIAPIASANSPSFVLFGKSSPEGKSCQGCATFGASTASLLSPVIFFVSAKEKFRRKNEKVERNSGRRHRQKKKKKTFFFLFSLSLTPNNKKKKTPHDELVASPRPAARLRGPLASRDAPRRLMERQRDLQREGMGSSGREEEECEENKGRRCQ